MKRKVKLAFEELERSLTMIPFSERYQILGGNGSGNSSGLSPNASADEIVDYFRGMGLPLTEDSSGNYSFEAPSGTIQLNEVTIFGQHTNNNSTGLSGDSSGGGMLGSFFDFFASFGYTFNSNGAGGYTYTPPPTTPPPAAEQEDVWKRDANGNLITTPTGKTLVQTYGEDYSIEYQEVKIKTTGNAEVIAYKVTKVKNVETGEYLTEIPEEFKSNCTGYAFAEGDVWLFDPNMDTTTNEMTGFDNMLKNSGLYTQTTAANDDANVAVVWWTDNTTGEKFIAHSGIVNSDGKFVHKDIYHTVITSDDEDEFLTGHTNSLYTVEVKYYKNNFQ